MIVVRETAPDEFERVVGNPTLTSLDGQRRAPLRTILSPHWSDEDRAAFGVYLVEPAPVPEGKRAVGARYERNDDGVVVEVLDLEDVSSDLLPPLTSRQIRLALLQAGKLSDVEQAIETLGDEAIKIEWEYATMFERSNPRLALVAEALEWSPEEIDALWRLGLSL